MPPRKRHDQHARIYRWERECDAYQSLSCKARALLMEFRLLYNGRINRIQMSVREAARRLGVSEKPAKSALDELMDRGFIRRLRLGSFNNKVRLASEYALTSEPIDTGDGATAPNDYMRWRKTTVGDSTLDGRRLDHRDPSGGSGERLHGSRLVYRDCSSAAPDGSHFDHTVKLPGGSGGGGEAS
jgi:hypothetical protein